MQTHLKNLQRDLRQKMTSPELILWQKLRYNQLGIKFRRQYTFGNYIIDFYAPVLNLAIEIDGDSHFIDSLSITQDKTRDKFLEKHGITILRLLNTDVVHNLRGCLEKIQEVIEILKSPT